INQTLSTLYGRPSKVDFVVILANRKRADLLDAGPLFPESAGEASGAAAAQAAAPAPVGGPAPEPAAPAFPAPEPAPGGTRSKRRVTAKPGGPPRKSAASERAVTPAAALAEPDFSEWDPRFNEIKRSHPGPLQPVQA